MEAKTIGNQRHTDHQQETQCQHHNGWIVGNEPRQRIGSKQHDCNGGEHSNNHNRNLVGHTDSGNDRIDGEHEIEYQYLHNGGTHRQLNDLAANVLLTVFRIDSVVNFLGRLPDEEKTTSDENYITPGETMIEGVEDRFFELHND